MKRHDRKIGFTKAAAAAAAGVLASLSVATFALAHAPSDSRATFVTGTASTCGDLGFPSSTKMGDGHASASDANVTGTLKPNNGSVQPGSGEEIDVALTGVNLVVDAILVSGSTDSYNKYTNQTYLPPTLGPDQHYIAPLTASGGTVPNITQWYVCYHTAAPVPAGTIGVFGLTGVSGIGLGLLSRRKRRKPAA